MSEIDKDNNLISCSRCHVKYHNTSESISKNFGYKRLGDRYKLCIKCRASTDIKECCVCMKRINKNNSVKITCNHGICKGCIDNIISHHHGSNIIKCPICRREYPLYGPHTHYDLTEPILFKTYFKNDISIGHSHPAHIFNYTSKTNLELSISGEFITDKIWLQKMHILNDILHSKNVDNLVFYVYKDGDESFVLKTNKPNSDYELVSIDDFLNNLQQRDEIIKRFLRLFYAEYLTKTEIGNYIQ